MQCEDFLNWWNTARRYVGARQFMTLTAFSPGNAIIAKKNDQRRQENKKMKKNLKERIRCCSILDGQITF